MCGGKQREEKVEGKGKQGGIHVCACAFAAALTFHPFKSLNTSQALKITLGHIPAFSASQREKMLKPGISAPQGLYDLLGLVVQRIKKTEILVEKEEGKVNVFTEANLMGCSAREEKVLLPD